MLLRVLEDLENKSQMPFINLNLIILLHITERRVLNQQLFSDS